MARRANSHDGGQIIAADTKRSRWDFEELDLHDIPPYLRIPEEDTPERLEYCIQSINVHVVKLAKLSLRPHPLVIKNLANLVAKLAAMK